MHYTLIIRICHTRKSTGTKLVSFALSVGLHWWINNLAPKRTESIVDLVMMPSLRHAAMAVMMCSEQVSKDKYKCEKVWYESENPLPVLSEYALFTFYNYFRHEENGVQDKTMARKMFCMLYMQKSHWHKIFHPQRTRDLLRKML